MKGIVIGMTAALVALPAAAQESGWYAGLSVGSSKAGDTCSNVDASVSCDDKTTAVKLIGGYQVNRNFAVELGFTPQLAKASASEPGVTEQIKSSAFEAVLVPSLPIGDFSLFGKLGIYAAHTEDTVNFFGTETTTSASNSDVTYGVGAGYQFTRSLGARAEWQRYSKVGGGDVGKADIDVVSLGLLYRF